MARKNISNSISKLWLRNISTLRDMNSMLESTLILALTVDDSNLGPSTADTLVLTFSLDKQCVHLFYGPRN